MLRLLLCGDVELNPGPTNQELLSKILDGQSLLRSELADLTRKTEGMIADLKIRFTAIEEHITELKLKTARLDELDSTIKMYKDSMSFQTRKLADLEDRSRRSNLVVFGVPEPPNETESDLKTKVITEIFLNKLGVICESVGRIHRLGKHIGNRPVILFFQNFNEKTNVLKNASKLKGTKIFVQNDYSQHTLQKRKLLWESAKSDKLEGKKVGLFHDKLKIDNDCYIWNEATNQRQKLPPLKFQSRPVNHEVSATSPIPEPARALRSAALSVTSDHNSS